MKKNQRSTGINIIEVIEGEEILFKELFYWHASNMIWRQYKLNQSSITVSLFQS